MDYTSILHATARPVGKLTYLVNDLTYCLFCSFMRVLIAISSFSYRKTVFRIMPEGNKEMVAQMCLNSHLFCARELLEEKVASSREFLNFQENFILMMTFKHPNNR